MRIKLNEKNEIIEYVEVGGLTNSIEYKGTVPDDFEEKFRPSFYLLENNEIVLNPYYVELIPSRVAIGPTTEQVMINQLGLKYAELSAKVGKLEGGGING